MSHAARAAREVVVITDEPDERFGVVVGKSILVDGTELLLPLDAKVEATISGAEALTVTVSFFASSVRFSPQAP